MTSSASCDSAVPTHLSPLLTWVESLESQQAEPVGVSQLHPDVFAVPSRLDILHQVEMWQRSYKRILRQHQGGVVHGPRGPTSYYYMLPMKVRVMGLKVALSSKLAQDYLYVVDSLDLPTPDPHLKTVNVIPAIGLNVHSLLKHEAVLLTLDTVRLLERKLLWHDSRYTPLYPFKLPYSDLP
ncbi:hypothetical protein CRUP_001069 [Coryphaenoides rupestris]|nr:hypothetical protein CRUP_001069 [Coryphaenoides rupestris]